MERQTFSCQICFRKFRKIHKFKQHLTSGVHKQRFRNVYNNDPAKRNLYSYTPNIVFKNKEEHHHIKEPVLGLSQMTLCFSSEIPSSVYLCHVCEEKVQMRHVLSHVFHENHYSSYFAYTDPNVLSFAWMSTADAQTALMPHINQELQKTGVGELQVLHLPQSLQYECERKTYSQAMGLLHSNKLLSDIINDIKPGRVTIQDYRDDANRKHPLLGLQHLVECISVGEYKKRHYLCTLCRFHVSSSMIFKHVLSFNHIFKYFNTWHPSTLMARESYKNCSPALKCALIDLAKQSIEIHGPTEMQQVKLKLDELFSLFGSSFSVALQKTEFLLKKGSLMPIVTPGMKLEPTSGGLTYVKLEIKPEPVTPESCTQHIKQENEQATGEPSEAPVAPSHSLYCQNCSRKFETYNHYFNHLSMCEHQERFKKIFEAATFLPLCQCSNLTADMKDNQLCVGMSLVVIILSHQLIDSGLCICLACKACFLKENLVRHMNSHVHFIQTLMYKNPWRLPFGWKKRLDYRSLKLLACEEEENQGPDQKMIKILDVPSALFQTLPLLSFTKVMEKLNLYHTVLMKGVPYRETFSKLQENERFPLLGRNFLVKFGHTTTGWKYLCLLCKRMLAADEYNGHIFSWEHVVCFLENYHPGSVDLKTVNTEILLDLAKQAARTHPITSEQEIETDKMTFEISDYSTKIRVLSAEKEKGGKGALIPCIKAHIKLVPRQKLSQEKDTSLTSANDTKATNESRTVKNDQCLPEKTAEKGADILSPEQSSVEPKEIQKAVKEAGEELSTNPMEEKKRNSKDYKSRAAAKRPHSMSEVDHCTNETAAGEQDPKRQRQSDPEKEMPKIPHAQSTIQQDKTMEVDSGHVKTCAMARITSKMDSHSESSEENNLIRFHGPQNSLKSTSSSSATDSVYPVSSHNTITNTATAPTINSSSLFSGSKSSTLTSKHGSQAANICIDSSFKMVTDEPRLSPTVGKSVNSEVGSESTRKDISNKMEHTVVFSCSTRTNTKPSKSNPNPKSTPHTTSTEIGNPLKLNISAARQLCRDEPVVKNGPSTPPLPNSGSQTLTTESSQKPTVENCQIGLDQIYKVTCKTKKHVYCAACVVRLETSNHLISTSHQINCVKLKFPWWSAKSENKLREMVALLADDEKALNIYCKKVEVTHEVYKELKTLPVDKALERVNRIMKIKSSNKTVQRQRSSETSTSPCEISTSPWEISTSPCVSISPFEATSPDHAGQVHHQTKQKEESSATSLEKIPVRSAPRPSTPVEKPASPVEAAITKGSTTENLSHLSIFLEVKGMDKPIIGLCFVWECRIVSPIHQETFYLCESCSRTLLFKEMFEHLASTEHQGNYMLRQYPKFMYWTEEDLPSELVDELTNDIAGWVSGRETSMDAQVVLLSKEYFEWVREAPFVEALKVVQRIKKEKRTTSLIGTSQHEVEPGKQPSIRPTLDSYKTPVTGLQTQMKASMLNEAEEKNNLDVAKQETTPLDREAANLEATPCTSHTKCNKIISSQVAELTVVSQQCSSVSLNPPKQDVSSCSDTLYSKQKLSGSNKDEHRGIRQSALKDRSPVSSPLNLESTLVSPLIDAPETKFTVNPRDTEKDAALWNDIKPELSCSSTTINLNTKKSDDNAIKCADKVEATEKGSPQSSSDSRAESTMASSTVGSNRTENPALDPYIQDEVPMDLLHLNMLIDLVKSAKSIRSLSKQKLDNLGESCLNHPKAMKDDDKMCAVEKTTKWDIQQLTKDQSAPLNVTDDLLSKNKDNLILSSDVSKLNHDVGVDNISISCELQTQQNLNGKSISEKNNTVQLSEKQNFQLQSKVLQNKSNIQGSHLQSHSLSSKSPVPQTEVKVEAKSSIDDPNSEDFMQLQTPSPEILDAATDGQLQKVQPNVEPLPIHLYQSQALQQEQSQVFQLQTQKIQVQMQQVPSNTGFSNNGHSQSFLDSQGLSRIYGTGTQSNNKIVTRESGQYFQTSYGTNEANNGYPNIHAQYAASQHLALPNYYHLPAQSYHTSQQPFGQRFQNTKASAWLHPNSQLQSVSQNYWTNGVVSSASGPSNMTYSNTVHFNISNNQRYTTGYNSVQDYNRVLMQNQGFSQPPAPPPVNSIFFNGQYF